MKNRKIFKILCSLALAGAMGASVLGGCAKKEEHAYILISTDVQVTCSNEGKETWKCGICGDVITKTIPIDPNAHVYGDWDIVRPTETSEGSAHRQCTLNSRHVADVVLPKITEDGEGYDSSDITTAPTSISEGVRSYVKKHPSGDIVIDVKVPVKPIETVGDAVLKGTSMGSAVRSSSGTFKESRGSTPVPFYNYYGDNYTHVKYRVNRMTEDVAKYDEFWYMKDSSGKVFGIEKGASDQKEKAIDNPSEENLLGYGYSSGVNSLRGYGAEDTLNKYYTAAQLAVKDGTAVKYNETIKKLADGTIQGHFYYRHKETPSFAIYTVDFTLSAAGVINSLTVETRHVRPFLIATTGDYSTGEQFFEEDGDVVYAEVYPISESTGLEIYKTDGDDIVYGGNKTKPDGTELKDRNGNPIKRPMHSDESSVTAPEDRVYYDDDHDYVVVHTLQYDAPVLKQEGETVEPCPYDYEDLYIDTFNVIRVQRTLNSDYSDMGLGNIGDEKVKVPSNEAIYFELTEVTPTSASVSYDPVNVFLRTENDGDIPLTASQQDNKYGVSGSFIVKVNREPHMVDDGNGGKYDDGQGKITSIRYIVSYNSKYAGEQKLVIKTTGKGIEKVINLDVQKSAPTQLMAKNFAYSDSTGEEKHIWTTCATGSTIDVYLGQKIYIYGDSTREEKQYCDTRSMVKVQSGGTGAVTVQNGYVNKDLLGIEDGVSVIEATRVGTVPVTVLFTCDDEKGKTGANARLIINVKAKPDTPTLQKMFRSVYTADLTSVKLSAAGEAGSGTAKITFKPSTNYWYRGTVTIDIDIGNGYGNEATYEFVYTEATNTLTVTYKEGLSNTIPTLDFTMAVNEVYKLTLTHSTGFGSTKETRVLTAVEEKK